MEILKVFRKSGNCRLDYQPLFGKGARAPPRTHERAAEIEPTEIVDFRKANYALR